MNKFLFFILTILTFSIGTLTVNAEVNQSNYSNEFLQHYTDTPETWVLVCIEGEWWWVIYNEDGSIKNRIPVDFWNMNQNIRLHFIITAI